MPAELQTRLLRVLADGEFYRVGGHEPVKADVRIIAATIRTSKSWWRGRFREDLFPPPQRDPRAPAVSAGAPRDIPLLMDHFLQRAARELGSKARP